MLLVGSKLRQCCCSLDCTSKLWLHQKHQVGFQKHSCCKCKLVQLLWKRCDRTSGRGSIVGPSNPRPSSPQPSLSRHGPWALHSLTPSTVHIKLCGCCSPSSSHKMVQCCIEAMHFLFISSLDYSNTYYKINAV